MAVPKRFRFKTKKKKFLSINNNQIFIKSFQNKKSISKLMPYL